MCLLHLNSFGFLVPIVQTELSGIVLSSFPAGDRFVRIRIFDQKSGLRDVLFSLPGKRRDKVSPPDLFDDLECKLSPRNAESSIPFASEFQIMKSYRELALDAGRFLSASEIARFYLNNGSHLLETVPRLTLLRSALDSFSRSVVPKAVVLKLYFTFARDEGLPVRESWLASLPTDLSQLAKRALSLPVHEIKEGNLSLIQIVDSLKLWMNEETELLVE